MSTIRDRLGHMTATQRLGSIQYLLIRATRRPISQAPFCLLRADQKREPFAMASIVIIVGHGRSNHPGIRLPKSELT